MVVVTLAATSAEALAYLLKEMTDEEVQHCWNCMRVPGEYPGHASARAALLNHAIEQGWTLQVRRSMRSAMQIAFIAQELRALLLLIALRCVGQCAIVLRLHGRESGVKPRAGHGSTAPVRGSPLGWLPLALPGVPPD
jgi:hypothetical protein